MTNSKHLKPEDGVEELEEGLEQIDIAEELEEPVEDVTRDMVESGYEIILPSSIQPHSPVKSSEGAYNVARDKVTASLNPDLFTLESLLAHELVHSTQESMEFGPMDQEEYEWNWQQVQRFSEIDCEDISDTYERQLVVGYALSTDSEKEIKHEIGRKQHRLRKTREEIERVEERIPGLEDGDLVYFQSDEKREKQREGMDRREELLERKKQLREELNQTLDRKVDEFQDEIEEEAPVDDYQTLERIDKYERLSEDDTRYHSEVFSYLTSHVFEEEGLNFRGGVDLQEEILTGIRNSEDSNIPEIVYERCEQAVESYRKNLESGTSAEAAAEVVKNKDLLLRKPTKIVSD